VRRLLILVSAAIVPLLGCGGGESPSKPTIPSPIPSPTVVLSLVDGDGNAVSDARLQVDGVPRSARTAGGNVFDLGPTSGSAAGRPAAALHEKIETRYTLSLAQLST
jgi:hypothetical protein